MPTAIEAGEMCARVREETQLFGLDNLVDGFAADPPARQGAIRILPALNSAYRQMRRHFYATCYFSQVLTIGQLTGRFPETDYTQGGVDYAGVPFDFIEEAFLIHPSTDKYFPLDVTSNAIENEAMPYRNNSRNRRPMSMWTAGDRFGFDSAPDMAYTLRLLVDTVPDDLVLRTDKPKRLAYTLQEGIIFGASVEMGRKALAMPAGQSIPEGRFLRYRELKERWAYFESLAREMANSRVINSNQSPLVAGINGWYQGVW